jgi:hypothetical protein
MVFGLTLALTSPSLSSLEESTTFLLVDFDEDLLMLPNHCRPISLDAADIWCSEILDYEQLRKYEGYDILKMEQEVVIGSGKALTTTRCPIRIDGELLISAKGAPALGEHTRDIEKRFNG